MSNPSTSTSKHLLSTSVGAGVAILLVALLFRGCGTWGQTTVLPKVASPAATEVAQPAEKPVATKPMLLTGVNKNGKFELSGVVPTDEFKTNIEMELKKTFGEGNYLNNLTVSADVKPASWLSKTAGMFDVFKLPGSEMDINADKMVLSGTAGSLKEKVQGFFGDSMKVVALDVAMTAKEATSNALNALNALGDDATGLQVLDALGVQIINFPSGSTMIPADNKDVLKKAAALLKSKQNFKFEVGGHADNQGKAASNLSLSNKRAAAVRSFLIAKGVPADMMTAKGYGDTQPIADNNTESGRLKNRRIAYKPL
ncbi:OmpA family protein [Hydromonas duriensis]|uniref:OOP family OmpA-OmpF porin n=1 Tax=Hydromonas duriensis TaxID=1527608 RepID=A0A4R6YA33_9BURK|nr:OmpA family protein [Hydromonas duriensis]TDR32393.1 OOP family OmpA-OmpF porin [Hydromonas duriensis]